MTIKLDSDLKKMTLGELRQEVMRLRTAFRKELDCTGDRRCWINLLQTPEGRFLQPLSLSEETFLENCKRYYNRNR